tara:strand:- start:602 stop:1618 length:1017 start_codon:yes stop_codon:yes gene_type:complete
MYIDNKYLKNQMSYWLLFMFVIIAIMIVIGGLTRLTDSGLSITKWELFTGFLPPLDEQKWNIYFSEYKNITEFKIQNYAMTLEEFKVIFWWEWVHRQLGRFIGLCFLIPLIYFTFKINFKNLIYLYLIFFLICFQGFIGWYMVSSGLINRVDVSHFRLSVHLVIAFAILSLIFWNYLNLRNYYLKSINLSIFFPITFLLIIFIQIIIGAFVSGMDAGKLYNTWPLMGESYFPDDNPLKSILSIYAFSDPSLVQFMHRNLAYLISIFYLIILFKVYNHKLKDLYKIINLLGVILLIQIILGILTLLYGAQIILASMHQISSIFLVSSSVYFLFINYKSN